MLTAIVLSISTSPPHAKESENSIAENPARSFFFPYHTCLAGSVRKITKYKRFFLIEFEIDEVLKGDNLKPNEVVIITAPDEPYFVSQMKTIKSRREKRTVIAAKLEKLTHWIKAIPGNNTVLQYEGKFIQNELPVKDLYFPFADKDLITNTDIKLLKEQLANVPKTKDEAKIVFKNFLEARWTSRRIKDFCRPENHYICSNPATSYSDWEGTLHDKNFLDGMKVTWSAKVFKNVPMYYAIYAKDSSESLWQLELCYFPGLPNWSWSDYLRYRVKTSISNSLYAYREINGRDKVWNKLSNQFIYDPNDKIERDSENRIVSYSCRLAKGARLTAEFNEKLAITSIRVNSKRNKLWNKVFEQTIENIRKTNKSLNDGTYGKAQKRSR